MDYLLCHALGKFPHELEEMSEDDYERFGEIVLVEQQAGRLRKLQDAFYG